MARSGSSSPVIQISTECIIQIADALKSYPYGLSKFVGLPSSPIFLTLQNPLNKTTRSGFNDKIGIALWPREGKKVFDTKSLSQLAYNCQPAMTQLLHDYDVNPTSSKKRVKKSCTRTIQYLQEYLPSKSDKNGGLFVTLDLSWFVVDSIEANKTVDAVLESKGCIDGFVLTGITFESNDLQNADQLDELLMKLPVDKVKFVAGVFTLSQILVLVTKGIDFFDSSNVTQMADLGQAFYLPKQSDVLSIDIPNEDLPSRSEKEEDKNTKLKETNSTVIDLKDKRYVFAIFAPSLLCKRFNIRLIYWRIALVLIGYGIWFLNQLKK